MIPAIQLLPFTLALSLLMGRSSSQQATTNEDLNQVRVEITTEKDLYVVGEPIRFNVRLINRGQKVIYIAKPWWYAGGGIAGFLVNVRQLSGRKFGLRCGGAADRGLEKDSRSPEQILREDFVRLGTGEFVGMEDVYDGCAVKYAGTYEIRATYSANGVNTHTVASILDSNSLVLMGQVDSKPYKFRVRSH